MDLPSEKIPSCGDASCEFLVSPIPRPRPRPVRVGRARRRRVVLMDHGKPNSITLLRLAQELLRGRGVEVHEQIFEKRYASRPMPDELLERLSQEDGLLLCGVSDCGSCSAGTVTDALLLHQRGRAGVPVLTAPFESVIGRVLTYYELDRPLPSIIIRHPTQNIDAAALQARAAEIADQAEQLLRDVD